MHTTPANYTEKTKDFLRANGGRWQTRERAGRFQVYDLLHVNQKTRASYGDEAKATAKAAALNAAEEASWAPAEKPAPEGPQTQLERDSIALATIRQRLDAGGYTSGDLTSYFDRAAAIRRELMADTLAPAELRREAVELVERIRELRDPAGARDLPDYRAQVRQTMQAFSDEALAFQSARIVGGIDREECDRELERRAARRELEAAAKLTARPMTGHESDRLGRAIARASEAGC